MNRSFLVALFLCCSTVVSAETVTSVNAGIGENKLAILDLSIDFKSGLCVGVEE